MNMMMDMRLSRFDGSRTCRDIDESGTEEVNCGCGDCVNTSGSYTCECDKRYELVNVDGSYTCRDIEQCITGEARCESGGYVSTPQPGLTIYANSIPVPIPPLIYVYFMSLTSSITIQDCTFDPCELYYPYVTSGIYVVQCYAHTNTNRVHFSQITS